MNKEQMKGQWNETKGKVKENVGHVTGQTRTEAEGVGDQIKGKVQQGFGNVKDAVKKETDKILDRDKTNPDLNRKTG